MQDASLLNKISFKEGNDINIKWCIVDESNQYVHADSIKKIGKEYIYTSYPRVERGYITFNHVDNALKNLELHNQLGKLNHMFRVINY